MTGRGGVLFLGVALSLSLVCVAGAQAQTQSSVDACVKSESAPDAGIAGCTDLLNAPGHNDVYRAEAYNYRGLAYYAKTQYDLAIADYSAAVALDSNEKYAYYNRGRAYYAQTKYDLAIADYTAALRIDADYKYAYISRSDVYYAMGQYAQTIADCTAALRIDPNYRLAYIDRGFAYQINSQYDPAIADFMAVLRLDPNDTTAYYEIGVVSFDAGRFSDASANFQRSLETGPKGAWDDALWLQLLRWRSGNAGTTQLAADATALDDTKWQAALIDMYLGKGTAAQSRDTATSSAKPGNERCEATFFIGEWDLMHHDRSALAELQNAVNICPHNNLLYTAARAEVRRSSK